MIGLTIPYHKECQQLLKHKIKDKFFKDLQSQKIIHYIFYQILKAATEELSINDLEDAAFLSNFEIILLSS